MTAMAAWQPAHFLRRMDGAFAGIQLNRPDRNNPLTFDSYKEHDHGFAIAWPHRTHRHIHPR